MIDTAAAREVKTRKSIWLLKADQELYSSGLFKIRNDTSQIVYANK